VTDRSGLLRALEANAPALFLVAGGLATVFAANTTLRTFAGTSYPVVQDVVGPLGFLLGAVGLFGLYPALAARTPTPARIAAAVAVVPTVGWFAILVMGIGNTLGVLSYPTGPLAAIPVVVILTMILAFGLFGITSLLAGVRSRVLGTLLLMESTMFLLLILNAVPFVLIDVGHVLSLLGVGVTLRTEGVPTERTDPTTDADAAP
jgi:hypothetical protein